MERFDFPVGAAPVAETLVAMVGDEEDDDDDDIVTRCVRGRRAPGYPRRSASQLLSLASDCARNPGG